MTTGYIPISTNLGAVEAAGDFTTYPVGEYLAQVTKIESATTKDGDPRLKIQATLMGGPGMSAEFNGKIYFDSYMLTEKGLPFLKRFLLALGNTEEVMAQWAQMGMGVPEAAMMGRQYCFVNAHREWEKKVFNQPGRFKVAALFNRGEGDATAGAGVVAPQPGALAPPPTAAPPPVAAAAPIATAPIAAPPQPPPGHVWNGAAWVPGAPPATVAPVAAAPAPVAAAPAPPAYPAAPPPPGQVPGQG